MTEAEWLVSEDPEKMVESLRGRTSDRKSRLFAAACCRRVYSLLKDERSVRAIEAAELYADGLIGRDELTAARDAALEAFHTCSGLHYRIPFGAAERAESERRFRALRLAYDVARLWLGATMHRACEDVGEPRWLSAVLKDIFRNSAPLPHSVFVWNDGTVPRLAQAVHQERRMPEGLLASDRLAVLADALEDAGCPDQELLLHLRNPGPHVRGCFAVDLCIGLT
jgi:hypothetical protein